MQCSSYFHFPANKAARMFGHLSGGGGWGGGKSFYRGLNWFQWSKPSRWSQQHFALSSLFLETTPSAGTVDGAYIPRTETEWGASDCPGPAFGSTNIHILSTTSSNTLAEKNCQGSLMLSLNVALYGHRGQEKEHKFWIWFLIWHYYCSDLRQTIKPFLATISS